MENEKIPFPETVEHWERRTGKKYLDTAPVYFMQREEGVIKWRLIENRLAFEPKVVATEAGAPPDDWRPETGTRKIMFRGRRIDDGKWVYGHIVLISDSRPAITDEYLQYGGKHIPTYQHDGNAYNYFYEVYPETVGQYTGLKDKNGKMIFEGDNVFFTVLGRNDLHIRHEGLVRYNEEASAFELWGSPIKPYSGEHDSFALGWTMDRVVIDDD